MQKKFGTILSIFIFARALTRGRTHARAFSDLKLTFLIDIDLNHDKYEWEMPFRYEDMILSKKYQKKHKMAPGWRHEDLMTLKMLLSRLMTMTYDCAKIERNWLNWSWVIHKKVRVKKENSQKSVVDRPPNNKIKKENDENNKQNNKERKFERKQ